MASKEKAESSMQKAVAPSLPTANCGLPTSARGMSFVDVVVGVGIMLVVFMAIFGAFKLAVELVYSTKAKAGGMALVTQQMEYVRGLSYTAIGTVGGIPSGSIPQTATTTLNNISYSVRTLVLYVDAPQDGTGGSDQTGVTADYKQIKVEVTWAIRGMPRSTYAITHVAPNGVESLTNGGTLRLNILDAVAGAVQDATVRIQNASTTPAIDLTLESASDGTILIPGAPAASRYRITVTKSGYSTAQTYDVTTANPNPNPGHLSVANQQTTTATFFIDRVGSLRLYTFSPVTTGFFSDTFSNQTSLFATTSTTVTGGALVLGTGALTGDATSIAVSPAQLVGWDSATWSGTTPAGTTRAVQVYYLSGGDYVLVPNAAIAGNSTGLTSGSVSLTGLATSTYPSLRLKALLTTNNASTTPTLTDWRIDYRAGPSMLPNVGLTVRGTKSVGQTTGGVPIYKYSTTTTSDQYGERMLDPLEWDTYVIGLSGTSYDIAEQCAYPLSLLPAQAQTVSLILAPRTTRSLRVVVSAAGVPLPNATVTIAGPTAGTQTSSACGQAFFSSLAAGSHTLTVSASGYQTNVQSISVSGATVVPVTLTP